MYYYEFFVHMSFQISIHVLFFKLIFLQLFLMYICLFRDPKWAKVSSQYGQFRWVIFTICLHATFDMCFFIESFFCFCMAAFVTYQFSYEIVYTLVIFSFCSNSAIIRGSVRSGFAI